MKPAKVELLNEEDSCSVDKKAWYTFLKPWIVIATAWLFYLYEYVLRVSPSVMTTELMLDFSVTTTALGVLASFYYFSYVMLQIPCGVIVDWLGPKRVITVSSVFCVAGSVLFSQSNELFMAQVGRFLMGAGSACAYLCCAKLASEWFKASKFAMITGTSMLMGTLGGTFGGRPFASLVNTSGWRGAMMWAALAGCIIAIIAWFVIRDRPSHKEKVHHHHKNLIKGLKVIASNPQNILIGIYGCMMYLPLSAFAELWGVPFLMQKYNVNNEIASSASVMVFIGMGLGSALSSWISDYFQSRVKIMKWSAVGTLIVFLGVFFLPNISFGMMTFLLFVGGLISGGQILYFAAGKENSPNDLSATSIGFTNFFVMVSGVIFQPLLGWLLDFAWDGQMKADGTPSYSMETYKFAFSAVCIALLVSWIVSKFIKETYPQD